MSEEAGAAEATSPTRAEELRELQSKLVSLELSAASEDGDDAPRQLIASCRRLATVAIELGTPLVAVAPLLRTVETLAPNPNCLTPMHIDYVQVCLKAKAYRAALRVLDVPILEVQPAATGLVTLDLLRYFYYGGMVYTGLQRYNDALEFFKVCVAAPSSVLSAVMTEAFKKMILVSLIVHGEEPGLPQYSSQAVERQIKACVVPYKSVAEAFAKCESEALDKTIEEHRGVFEEDNNMGLVKQCTRALTRRRIKRLTHTYLTLSLDDIAENVGLSNASDAERYVLDMVASSEIYASINQRDGMVEFLENPEQYECGTMLSKLDGAIQKIVELTAQLKQIDDARF